MRFHYRLLLSLLALSMALPLWAGHIPYAVDLEEDAQDALDRAVPIMVMFSSDSCAYCERLMEEYIEPMSHSADYAKTLIIRVVELERSVSLLDFDGERVGHEEFADRYNVTLVPVVKFLDHTGAELVPELVGYSSEDFYGYYLDAKLDLSQTKMRDRAEMVSASPTF